MTLLHNLGVVRVALADTDSTRIPSLIASLLTENTSFNSEFISAIQLAVEKHELNADVELRTILNNHAQTGNPNALWLTARLDELAGNQDAAIAAWTAVLAHQVGDQAEAMLARARLLNSRGDFEGAFGDLRRATALRQDYRFLAQAATLFRRIRKQARPQASRQTRIAFLSSTTADLLVPILLLLCHRDNIDAEFYVAPYGNISQEALNPASGLYQFEPDIVLIVNHWRDLNLPELSMNPKEQIQRVIEELTGIWQKILATHPCHIIQHNFDLPPYSAYGNLTLSQPGGRSAVLREINCALLNAASAVVSILDVEFISSLYGKLRWFDAPYWHLAKQIPAPEAIPFLAHHQVAMIRARLGLSRKVLVLDLDNTLWGGVIGEDGVEGIQVGPPSALGEAHQELQRYVLSLKERGIVLAVCSKNNEEDARLPFTQHDGMLLKLDDFVAFRANWNDKASNMRAIAEELSLGLDSFVFVDDNPIERAAVRLALPDVAVPELGVDPATFVGALDAGRYFDVLSLSAEDFERHASYRAESERREMEHTSVSLEEFLRGLQMESEVAPVSDKTINRVVQLLGKTNQFNLTSRRHSEEQVRRFIQDSDVWTCAFKLRDKFGDYGLIGVIFAVKDGAEDNLWEIDTWLMSCRVLGRQMEQFMINEVINQLGERGATRIRGVYMPTKKNGMVADLYTRLGFEKTARLETGEYIFSLQLPKPADETSFVTRVTVE